MFCCDVCRIPCVSFPLKCAGSDKERLKYVQLVCFGQAAKGWRAWCCSEAARIELHVATGGFRGWAICCLKACWGTFPSNVVSPYLTLTLALCKRERYFEHGLFSRENRWRNLQGQPKVVKMSAERPPRFVLAHWKSVRNRVMLRVSSGLHGVTALVDDSAPARAIRAVHGDIS